MNLEIFGGIKTFIIMGVLLLFILIYYELVIGRAKRENIQDGLKFIAELEASIKQK